ncbi:hypothetical protein SLE2022_262160 [Rubroshorea leprosula]
MNVLIQSQNLSCSSEVPDSFWIPTPYPLQAPKSMADYKNVNGLDPTDAPFFQLLDKEEDRDDDFDGSYNPPGKKRRLTTSQVQFLEKNFEVENKLEPERKVRLAKELGLQPRQVAIWFQNRRARFKNKQLEKDYDSLKARYDKLKNDYENLLKEEEDLKNQIASLKEKLLINETGKHGSLQIDVIDSSNSEPQEPTFDTVPGSLSDLPFLVCKQEEASSAKSAIFDSESPIYTNGNHSSSTEPADSSNVLEQEQSEEEDNPSQGLLHPPYLLKLEDDYEVPPEISCSFGFPVEDQSFWSSFIN